MFCQNCGKEVSNQAQSCPNCGHPMKNQAPAGDASSRSRTVALLLCLFVGFLGVHRFYVGKVGTGILCMFSLGGLGILVLIDLIMIIAGSFTDKQGKFVANWS